MNHFARSMNPLKCLPFTLFAIQNGVIYHFVRFKCTIE